MHHFVRAADVKPAPAFPRNAAGYRRFTLSDRSVGAVHTGWGFCEVDAGGRIDLAMHSFEKSFFVLAGNPTLILDGRGYRLSPGACGLIPVGMKHAWLGPTSGTARWIDMNAPCPKGENFAEVVNIMASLLNSDATPHVRLTETHDRHRAPSDPVITSMMESPAKRRVFDVNIEGYGRGRIVFLFP